MAFTYFLRDLPTLELAVKNVLPQVAGRSHVRVWDAGCAMGQEPYSLAMVFAENMGYFAFKNLKIHASDIDDCETFGDIVRTGVYPEEEVKRMPAGLLDKYFQPADRPGHFQVSEILRSRIDFQRHNLLTLSPVGEGFSLIVCKNVLLHFQASERVDVFRMFHRSLAPEGILATEQTQKLPESVAHLYEQVTPEAQIFRKKEKAERVVH